MKTNNIKFFFIIVGILPCLQALSQTEMNDDFNRFISEFGIYITLSCDCQTTQDELINIRNDLETYFVENTSIYNDCSGEEQNAQEYFKNYIPKIKSSRCGSIFSFYTNNIIPITQNKYEGKVTRKVIGINESEISTMSLSIFFLYDATQEPPNSIKIIKISIDEKLNKNFKKRNALCSPPRKKISLAAPIILIGLGGASAGGAFYFQKRSHDFYETYKSTFPSADSESLYKSANKYNHTKVVLNYAGIGLASVGVGVLVKKLINRKKFESYSSISLGLNDIRITYRF